MDEAEIRTEGDRCLVVRSRLVEPAQLLQHAAQVVLNLHGVGPKTKCRRVLGHGLVKAVLRLEYAREIIVKDGEIRLKPDRRLAGPHGFVRTAHHLQDATEATLCQGQIRRDAEGILVGFLCLGEAAHLEQRVPHVVVGESHAW